MKSIKNESELNGVPYALVDFWSPTCGPCRKMKPVLESIEKLYKEVIFFDCNVLEYRSMAQKYMVEMLPTIIVIKNGIVVYRNTGVIDSETLETELENIIDPF